MKIRRLINLESGEKLVVTLSNSEMSIEKSINNKYKTIKKDFINDEEANAHFDKKVWELLKKGYLLKDVNCNIYEPMLHYFVGKGYTGCLALGELSENEIITQKNGNYEKGEKDFLLFISVEGELKRIIELPQILPWAVLYTDVNKSLYIDNDHIIYEFNLQENRFTQMTSKYQKPASFISSNGSRILYCSHPTLEVRDLTCGKIVFSREIDCDLYGGHTAQLTGAISRSGRTVALCLKTGEIMTLNADTGEIIDVINIQDQLITKMEFVSSDNELIVLGSYGLCIIDIKNRNNENYFELVDVNQYCLNKSQDILAVLKRKEVLLFDLKKRQQIHSFEIENMVKTANIRFIGDRLGVRTDYGCLSLYKI